ncbi:unnamed protein product, partial [Prorocentrum cordatum]
ASADRRRWHAQRRPPGRGKAHHLSGAGQEVGLRLGVAGPDGGEGNAGAARAVEE